MSTLTISNTVTGLLDGVTQTFKGTSVNYIQSASVVSRYVSATWQQIADPANGSPMMFVIFNTGENDMLYRENTGVVYRRLTIPAGGAVFFALLPNASSGVTYDIYSASGTTCQIGLFW